MYYVNKTLYLPIFLGFVVLSASNAFDASRHSKATGNTPPSSVHHQVQQTPQPKRLALEYGANIKPVRLQQNSVIQLESDRMAQVEDALRSKDDLAIQKAVDGIKNCRSCLKLIEEFMSSPDYQLAEKIALGEALMQSATQTETYLLVNAIVNAHARGDADLAEGLLRVLDNAQTPEAAAALTAIVTRGTSGVSFHQLPEDVQVAVQNAIRSNPFPDVTGKMLVAQYNHQVSPDVAGDLESLQQPVMLSLLAKQAYDSGDITRTEQLARKLSTMEDAHALDGLMQLVMNNVESLDEVSEKAYAWVSNHSGLFDQDHYAAYLSNFDTTSAQRSVAAFALAASQGTASARAALEKASVYETDPLVLSSIESAIRLLSKD